MKRNISFILTLTMILSAFPISPYAQDVDSEPSEYGEEVFVQTDEYESDFDLSAELSAASPLAITADFENEEEGELPHGYRGENFVISNGQPEIDSFGIFSEDGNKFARISNAAYDGSSSSRLVYNAVKTGDVVNLSYRIRFVDKAPVHWIPVNIGENNVSATYFNDGIFGINYGGDYARNPRAQAKYKNYSVDLFKPQADVWYTVNYRIDFADQSYDLSIADADGNEQIADTDLATGVPFRNPNGSITAANMGECRFFIPHNAAWNNKKQPGEATTAEYVYDVDDIKSSTDEKAAALKAFNAADEDSIGDVIREFAPVLGLDCEGEYAVKSAYINYLVAKEIPFAAADDIKAAFDSAVEKAASINGDFTRKYLLDRSADTVATDFEDCTPGMSDSTITADGYSAFLMADGKVGYVREDNNTYLCLDQNVGKKNANTIYLQYALPDSKKATVSYRLRIDKLNSSWTTLYIGGASNLFLLNNKFALHMGSTQPTISNGTVTEGVWYTVVSDFDIAAQKYNLKITGDDGTTLVDMKDVAYRNSVSRLGNLTIGCAQAESASKICIDDIKTVSYPKDDLFFGVYGTKSLLPGENRYDVDFTNLSGADREPTLYLFVYRNDELVGIENKKFAVADGSVISDTMTVTADLADFESGDEFSVQPYLLDSLSGGLNYSADTAFDGSGEINASVTADYDEHKFVINGDMPFDVLRVLILAPGKTEADAVADPRNIVYFETADSLENINLSAEIDDRFGSGDYKIYLVSQNSGGTAFEKEISAYYCGNAVADGIVADFRGITESNAESIMDKYINTYPIMNDFDNFASFYETNKSSVNEILIGSKSKINKVSDIKDLLGVAYVVAALHNAADEAEFETLLETNSALFGIDTTDSAYKINKTATISRLFAKRTALTSANIASEFDTALMLAEFNGADRTTIESVLTKYKSVTGIDTASAAYINNKANVNKALTADGVVFNSVADIVAAYNSALSASGSSGAAGGGGGGGSKVTGGGFGSDSTITVDKPYVEPDTPLITNSDEFCDLGSAEWARKSIMRLRASGVINGVDADHFEPDRFVTREEFAKMIACAFGINGGAASFDDVDGAQWYAPFVAALFSNGIVNGISETSFGVGSGISRQDAAVILDRTAAHMGKTLEYDVSALNTFGDYIAPYARDSVLRLYQSGIVSGVSEKVFDAEGTLTRAQAAKLIDGLVQLAK